MNRVTQTRSPTDRKSQTDQTAPNQTVPNQPGLICLPNGSGETSYQTTISNQGQDATISNHSNSDTSHKTMGIESVVMGKLCRRVLALIKHKVGTDGAVSNRMAQALASCLRLWGITIYTETEL
jgi:hypothetical protein